MSTQKQQVQQILLHIVLWSTFYGILLYPFITTSRPIPINLPIRLILMAVLFYFNYFYLVPRFLLKKKVLIHLLISVAIVFILVILVRCNFPRVTLPEQMGRRPPINPFVMYAIGLCVPIVISTLLRIYTEWRKNDDLRQIV
ncbi:MAG: sensor histidine kinase, partial [Flavobacteriaceae bacterium]